MQQPWYQRPTVGILSLIVLSLTVVFLINKAIPILDSVFAFFYAVLFPFLLSMVIYYAVRPIVRKLRKKVHPILSIIFVYILLFGGSAFLIFYIYPHIVKEVVFLKSIDFDSAITNMLDSVNAFLAKFHLDISYKEERSKFISLLLSEINASFTNNIVNLISVLTTLAFDIMIIPFILFFLLKDDAAIYSGFQNKLPPSYQSRISDFLNEVDSTLVHFITGRVIIGAIIGVLLLIAFLAIGIESAYILASLGFVFFIIPSIGWILASILPVLVGFSTSITMGVEVVVIMMVAAALEGLWLTPQILGLSLTIHPLTIILILLAAGYMYGLVGLIFITPAYALLKVLVMHVYKAFNYRT